MQAALPVAPCPPPTIAEVQAAGAALPSEEAAPAAAPPPPPLFAGLHFRLGKVSEAQRDGLLPLRTELKQLLLDHGGALASRADAQRLGDASPHLVHLVVDVAAQGATAQPGCLDQAWARDCVDQGRLLDRAPYDLNAPAAAGGSARKTKRRRGRAGENGGAAPCDARYLALLSLVAL